MKSLCLLLITISSTCFGQANLPSKSLQKSPDYYVRSIDNLTLEAAFELNSRATKAASLLDKKVAIVVLDASGAVLLISRDNSVGPHNADAARRKAFTALSTKTSTLVLLRNAGANTDTKNLNTIPELLLLSGGVPIWFKGNIIGSIGIAGGGNPENDDMIARSASIPEMGITTSK